MIIFPVFCSMYMKFSLCMCTHVHLHDGPKVVHRYDLQSLPGQTGVYHLRSSTRQPVRDEPHGDPSAR